MREDAKAAVLLHLLRNVVRPQDQTVVFVATKHHAEYLNEVSGDAPTAQVLGTNTYLLHCQLRAALPCLAIRGQHQSRTPA